MKRLILLAFIGVLLMKNAAPSKNQKYPSRLAWLFGINNKLNENKDENNEENKPTICQSQECEKIARIISESMDKSVDPCDDFYEYACGNWLKHNPPPKEFPLSLWSMFFNAQMNVMRQIQEILDEGPKKDDLLAVKLTKKWYAVCMDTDTMDRQGLEPLVFTLSRIGGWPMIMDPDEWNEQEYSWQKVDDQYVRLMGRNVFHDVRIVDDLNETRNIIHIATPHLPPGWYKLWHGIDDSEKEEDKSDEDASDEEKQTEEQQDSQEPGSEGKDDDKDDSNNKNDDDKDDDNKDDNDDDDKDNKDDDNDDNEDNDNDDDSYEQDDDVNAKKKVGKKKNKFARNKKFRHSKEMKSGTRSEKHGNHKMKKERVKRRVIQTNVQEKLRVQKNKKYHSRKARRERLKQTKEATTPPISTEETTDEDDMVKKYADYILKVARAIAKARGMEVSEEHINKDIQDMMNFQIKLIDIAKSAKSNKDEELTLNDLQEWYDEKNPETDNSNINWMYKIGELFDEAHVPVDGDVHMKISLPDYFKNLVVLLDETSSRTIVNYIHWNFLSRIIKTTTSEMRELYNAWEGNNENDDDEVLGVKYRSMKCTWEVEMTDILAYEYVGRYFVDEIKTTASDMIDDIQQEVKYQIKESDWMDEDTQDFVLAKLVNMEKFIGYPNWYKNDTIVKRYFQGLIIGNSYYENTLSYDRYSKWKRLRKFMNKDDDDEVMMMSPIMVNAFFSPDINSIALSAADFQSPLFAYGRPQAINYGIIGSIMAHEVNHGFDNEGRLYNKNGEIVEWLSAMAEAYGKRAECFVEQFNNYPIDKETNSKIENYGNQTAGENIADTMGLEAAFRAYRRRERECGKPDAKLPGHKDLTNDQLFFLSFANLWCEAAETNDTIISARFDVHSTGRLRVIGSVSNSQDFAKAFNCSVGSAMNPERKCHIWK